MTHIENKKIKKPNITSLVKVMLISNSNIIQIQIMIRDKTTNKENFSPKEETHQEIPKSN